MSFRGIPCVGCGNATAGGQAGAACKLCANHARNLRAALNHGARDPRVAAALVAAAARLAERRYSKPLDPELGARMRSQVSALRNLHASECKADPRDAPSPHAQLTDDQVKQHAWNMCSALRRLAAHPGLAGTFGDQVASLPREAGPVLTSIWGRLAAPRKAS